MRTTMTRLGFSVAAAQAAVNEQGIDTLEEVKHLTDDEIESLCKVLIRRPGGTVPPPAGAAAGAAQVPNPGVPVNQRAEGHLKLLAFPCPSSVPCQPHGWSGFHYARHDPHSA